MITVARIESAERAVDLVRSELCAYDSRFVTAYNLMEKLELLKDDFRKWPCSYDRYDLEGGFELYGEDYWQGETTKATHFISYEDLLDNWDQWCKDINQKLLDEEQKKRDAEREQNRRSVEWLEKRLEAAKQKVVEDA